MLTLCIIEFKFKHRSFFGEYMSEISNLELVMDLKGIVDFYIAMT